MSGSRQISIVLILILSSCIDQLQYRIDLPENLPISVYGHISNQPGPYQIHINRSFDSQSLEYLKTPISVQRINLIDELGNTEELDELSTGIYQTSPSGMQGRIGGVYTLRIELFDGKIYESFPDTLLPPGTIDSIYHAFNLTQDLQGNRHYGFDLMVNAHENDRSGRHYMWNMIATFKAITHPELMDTQKSQCYPLKDEVQKCNALPLCTGLKNTAPRGRIPAYPRDYIRVGPCECCTCWYQLFNTTPILSDNLFTAIGIYNALHIYRIPLNSWTFMFKVHAEVTQSTLTLNSFLFFKSISDQKKSTGSLFQPITGKIPNTFTQIKGTPAPINGIFYAAGIDVKNTFVTRDDVPNQSLIPSVRYDLGIGLVSCLELFPNATATKPIYWTD